MNWKRDQFECQEALDCIVNSLFQLDKEDSIIAIDCEDAVVVEVETWVKSTEVTYWRP